MFTRVVEINAKSGQASELAKTIQEKVLSILKKQTGFMDETVLVSDTEPNRIIGLSSWNSKTLSDITGKRILKSTRYCRPCWRVSQSSGHSTYTRQPRTGSRQANDLCGFPRRGQLGA